MQRREALTLLAAAPLASAADPLARALRSAPVLRRVASDPSFELQVLLTRYRVDGGFAPIATYRHGVDDRRWFAAASFVKPLLALQLLETLTRARLSAALDELWLHLDGSSCAPLPSLPAKLSDLFAHMLVVSDNPSFNALYELIGSDALHARLAVLGMGEVRIPQRLGCTIAAPGKLRARLVDDHGTTRFVSDASGPQAAQRFPFGAASKGRAWLQNGHRIEGPHDFSASNFVPLSVVHRLIGSIGRADTGQFEIDSALRQRLRAWMSLRPRDIGQPKPDDHSKWLIAPRDSVTVVSKNAQSYGYIGDSAFVAGKSFAFALSAILFVDRDGVLNDARYAYDEIGRPFLKALGEAVLAAQKSGQSG